MKSGVNKIGSRQNRETKIENTVKQRVNKVESKVNSRVAKIEGRSREQIEQRVK